MRVRKSLTEKLDEAEREAREAALVKKPKRKYTKRTPEEREAQVSNDTKWIEDKWGTQGFILFHENIHWITELRKKDFATAIAQPRGLTEEEWAKYISGDYTVTENGAYEFNGRSVERIGNIGTTGDKQATDVKTDKRRKSPSGKTGKRKSVSRKKSAKVARGKGKEGKPLKNGKKPQQKVKKNKEKEGNKITHTWAGYMKNG